MTHATEIPTPLFPYGGGEQDGTASRDARLRQGPNDRHEGGEAPCIVRDPGSPQDVAVDAYRHVGAGREDGVQVGGQHQRLSIFGAGAEREYVTDRCP